MSASPEQIENEIAQTREEIKTDVDALSEKLDPRKAASRQAGKVKDSVTAAKSGDTCDEETAEEEAAAEVDGSGACGAEGSAGAFGGEGEGGVRP